MRPPAVNLFRGTADIEPGCSLLIRSTCWLGQTGEQKFDRATSALTGALRTTREKIEATLFGEPRFATMLISSL